MRSISAFILIAVALAAQAKPEPQPEVQFVKGGLVENAGVKSILSRRKTMKHVEHPVAQRFIGGSIVSVYADDSIKTQAVSMVRMDKKASVKIDEMIQDQATLKAARALVESLKTKHGEAVDGMSDAEIVRVSETVLDTSSKDSAVGVAVGLALAAAGAAAVKIKKPKKEKNV